MSFPLTGFSVEINLPPPPGQKVIKPTVVIKPITKVQEVTVPELKQEKSREDLQSEIDQLKKKNDELKKKDKLRRLAIILNM